VLDALRHFLLKIHSELTPRAGVASAGKCIHPEIGWMIRVFPRARRHGGARQCRIRNWNVARERAIPPDRGLHPRGERQTRPSSPTDRRDRKNVAGMRDIRPPMYRRYKPGGGRGQRWRCPSATRLHIGELSAGPGPRDRCDAAIPRRRRRVRSPTNFPA